MSRAQPKPSSANYLLLRTLAVQLRTAMHRAFDGRSDLRLLDIGCGSKPYLEFTQPWVTEYVGLEHEARPGVDVVGLADDLPFPDASFDAVLCSQVLEHVEEPAAVIREISRVLRPGGVLFLSTHGSVGYHPNPDDFWRWTHSGLSRLLRTRGDFAEVAVTPNGGTATTIAYLTGQQLEVFAWKARLGKLLAPVVLALNVVAWSLDRLVLRIMPGRFPTLSPNYLAVAVRPPQ